MKNKKVLTLVTLAGLTLGGLSVATAASAQGYGGSDPTASSSVTETQADTDGTVQIQLENDDTDADADTDTEGTVEGEAGDRSDRDGHRRGGRGGCNVDDAAEAIGIDEAELQAALDDGQTIAEVAEANGVSVDAVIDAMVDAKAEHLAEKVEEGRMTQEEADEKLADTEAKITDRVNGVDDTPEA